MKGTALKENTTSQPTAVRPMLSTLVKQPFNDESYVFEIKWDGYRIIAYCQKGNVKLRSRGGEDYTRKYPAVARALKTMDIDCVLDGEVVYVKPDGKPDFDALQRVNGQKAPIVFYAFDLLWLEGRNLMNKPLTQRKELLAKIIAGNATIKYSDHFDDGVLLFEHVSNIGLEGIMRKEEIAHIYPMIEVGSG